MSTAQVTYSGHSWLPVPVHHEGKPRLLYLVTRGDRAGAQVHVHDLACAMRQEFDVAVATGEEGFLAEACRESAIPVHILPHLQRQVWPPRDVLALWEMRRLIRQVQPDLIHTHTFKAGFLGRLAGSLCGVPSIHTVHTWLFGTPALPRLWSMLGAPCERFAACWCERVITVSKEGARIAHRHRIATPAKIITIHNGIPDCPGRARLDRGHPVVITMVARFAKAKDQNLLLRAFASLPPAPRLRFIGSGPLQESSEKLAKELGIQNRVEFMGDREDVASLLAASDVFVLATKFEMFALSILEAMRAGLPVIASDAGGNREAVVDGETGFLVPVGSVTALAEVLRMVIDDPELRLRLGRAARQRFEEYFLFNYQERYTRYVYHDVLIACRRVTLTAQASVADRPGSNPARKVAA